VYGVPVENTGERMSNMTTILVQCLAGFMLIFFAAMAIFPMLVSDEAPARTATSTNEDRVLHVSPVPMIERIRPAAENQPFPLGNRVPDEDSTGRDAA
jgi:hypothetical protein